MGFVSNALHSISRATGIGGVPQSAAAKAEIASRKPPAIPNVNDAANAAQQQTDEMRARRGLLANIYAGASSQAPVVGKTQLGV